MMQESLQLARFHLLERIGESATGIADPAGHVISQLSSLNLSHERLRGKQIAVTAGSRGIANLREIIRAACQWLSAQGAKPFVFPAMGSHGGATDEGQRSVLAEYGVVPEFVGAEVRSSIEPVQIGETPEGFPVLMDRNAWEADGVLVVNRVKPHTGFSGTIESGLVKMMVIGMGKQRGAQEYHALFVRHGFETVARSIASVVLASGKILAGLAVVENSRHQLEIIRAARPAEIPMIEEELLLRAKALMPRLPFSHLQLLIVDEIGKDVSGSGMDAKVIGRNRECESHDSLKIDLIYARSLTNETDGNALGVGMADLVHERLYRRIDFEKSYVNARTALNPWVVRLPMRFHSDREALDFAIYVLGSPASAEQRVVSIRNTLSLDRILISEALLPEALKLTDWQVGSRHNLEFDEKGDLPLPALTQRASAA